MAAKCSFEKIVGGICGIARRDRKTNTEIIPLSSCKKDISMHKLTWAFGADLNNEVELILARSKIFTTPENLADLTICPSHRESLGIGWRRGPTCCVVPQEISGHKSKRKLPRCDRGIDRVGSQSILSSTGVFLPVGSGKCILHQFYTKIVIFYVIFLHYIYFCTNCIDITI